MFRRAVNYDRVNAIAEGLHHIASRLPPYWIDAGVIRILWGGLTDAPPVHFRLSLEQAERLVAGETLEQVMTMPPMARRREKLAA